MEIKKSGFAAIVGRPNVGKSTLLNAILGEKLAIISSKPQTTRNRITGIYTKEDTQIIFLDTPGLFRPKNKLGEYMVKTVADSISDVDAAILVTEPEKEQRPAEEELVARLKTAGVPVVLAINKIDTLEDKTALMGLIASWTQKMEFAAIVPVSASTGDGVEELTSEIRALMSEGPQYYPDDILTTDTERVVVAEIIREKLLMLLSEEIPHGTAVTVEKMHERSDGEIVDIEAVIYCEKESHKGMIIGKGGAMLKKVGSLARADIEKLLGFRVNLQLWVKVREDWRNRSGMLKNFGFK